MLRLSSDVDWEKIKIGDKVVGATGCLGEIVHIDPKFKTPRYDGYIEIMFDGRTETTTGPRFLSDCPWFDSIEYIGS